MAVRRVGDSAPEPSHQEPETENTGARAAGGASSPQPKTAHPDAGHAAAPDSTRPAKPPAQTAQQQQLYAQLALANGVSPSQLPVSSTQLSKDVASLGGAYTPQKLQTLKSALNNQPPQVLAQTLKNPNVQQLLKGAAQWIAAGDARPNWPATLGGGSLYEASSRLATAVKGLPPEFAAQVVKESLPTIEKMADPPQQKNSPFDPLRDFPAYSPPAGTFKNLSSALGTLDNSPASEALINQVATAYAKSLTSSPSPSTSLNDLGIPQAIKQGGSPTLAMAMATQLASAGKPGEAGLAVKIATSLMASGVKPDSMLPLANQLASAGDSAGAKTLLNTALHNTDASHIKALQGDIKQDLDQYNKLLPDLKSAIGATQGMLTPQQLQKAINDYKPMQPVLAKMKADVQALNRGIAQTTSLEKQYPSLKGLLSGPVSAAAGDKNVQTAVTLMAQKDPKIFAGGPDSEAGEAFSFWSDQASRSHDLANALTGAYFTNDVLPAFDELRTGHNSPEAVAQAKQALNGLQGKYKLLGIDPKEAKKAVGDLNDILDTYTKGGASEGLDAHALAAVNKKAEKGLGELKDLPFSNSSAGVLIRGLGVALAGAAAVGAAKDYMGNKSLQNTLNLFSSAAGLASQGADAATTEAGIRAAARVGVHIAPDGFISVVGDVAERFAGPADAAAFFVGAISDLSSGNYTDATLSTAGGVGAVVAFASEDFAASGIGLAIGAAALIYEHDQNVKHTNIDKTFLEGAVGSKQAAVLSTNSAREGEEIQQQLGLSAQQLQALAAQHPDLFNSHDEVTQTFIQAAQACGVKGANTLGFAAALAKDDPQGELLNRIAVMRSTEGSMPAPAQQAQLYGILTSGQYPNVTGFLKQHLPQEMSKAADDRRKADASYDGMLQSGNIDPDQAIVNLLHGQDANFQAEIIKQMHQDQSLGEWLQNISEQGSGSSVQTARTAIQAAEKEHVLSPNEARQYLKELHS